MRERVEQQLVNKMIAASVDWRYTCRTSPLLGACRQRKPGRDASVGDIAVVGAVGGVHTRCRCIVAARWLIPAWWF